MKISGIKPNSILRKYISRYWLWEDEAELPPLLPGSGAELLFFYKNPADIVQSDGQEYKHASSALLLPRKGRMRLKPIPSFGFFSVRFRIGALRHFSPLPEHELIDRCLDAAEIWGHAGSIIEERIVAAENLDKKVEIIDSFLIEQLKINFKNDYEWLDVAVNQIYYARNIAELGTLSKNYGICNRHLQRVFKNNFGLSLKYFQRIIRIEAVVRDLLLVRRSDYLGPALERGFYDQSHFIKDCKQFIGETPGRFFQEANFRSHFYNHPLV